MAMQPKDIFLPSKHEISKNGNRYSYTLCGIQAFANRPVEEHFSRASPSVCSPGARMLRGSDAPLGGTEHETTSFPIPRQMFMLSGGALASVSARRKHFLRASHCSTASA